MNRDYAIQKLRDKYNIYVEYYFRNIVDIFNDYFGEERVDFQCDYFDTFKDYIIYSYYYNPETHLISTHYSEREMRYLYNEPTEVIDAVIDSNDIANLIDRSLFYPIILVHFPEVKVTNESGKSTIIKDLFAKITLNAKGYYASLKFCKTHYTYSHFIHGYMHSHVPKQYSYSDFDYCCTGSGPINNTIHYLNYYNEDTDYNSQWLQFCWDLDKYVTIESEEGIPYLRLSKCESEVCTGGKINLGFNGNFKRLHTNILTYKHWKDFIKYLIDNKAFKFKWSYKKWQYAHSNDDLIIIVSTYFLEWCKKYYQNNDEYICAADLTSCFFNKVISLNNKLFNRASVSPRHAEDFQDKELFIFKGVMQKLRIDAPHNDNIGFINIFDTWCIENILGYLLKIVNIYYGKNTIKEDGNTLPIENF